jgi:hypothetical protein
LYDIHTRQKSLFVLQSWWTFICPEMSVFSICCYPASSQQTQIFCAACFFLLLSQLLLCVCSCSLPLSLSFSVYVFFSLSLSVCVLCCLSHTFLCTYLCTFYILVYKAINAQIQTSELISEMQYAFKMTLRTLCVCVWGIYIYI